MKIVMYQLLASTPQVHSVVSSVGVIQYEFAYLLRNMYFLLDPLLVTRSFS